MSFEEKMVLMKCNWKGKAEMHFPKAKISTTAELFNCPG
jgi:hypothetical protein